MNNEERSNISSSKNVTELRKKRWKIWRGTEGERLIQEFRTDVLAIQETPPSPFTRLILWGLALLIVLTITWTYFSKLPIMTSAAGKFTTSARTKVVQSFDSGTVSAILVHAGEEVKKGQTLIELNPQVDRSTLNSQVQEMALARLEEQRIQADVSGSKLVAPDLSGATPAMMALESKLQRSELANYKEQLADDRAQIAEARATLAAGKVTLTEYVQRSEIARQEVNEAAPLLKDGAISGRHYDQLADAAFESEGKVAAQRKKVVEQRQALVAAQDQYAKDRSNFVKKLYRDWQNDKSQIFDIAHKVSSAEQAFQHNWLKSPIDGIVQEVGVASLGTVVQSGQTVATVVPLHAPLRVIADVPSQDVGFIKVGQSVNVKASAFPFEQYGMIHGVVTGISPTAGISNTISAPPPGENHNSPDDAAGATYGSRRGSQSAPPTLYYRVHIQPKQDWLMVNGRRRYMRPGMTATVDIRTGQRSVLDFFLDPVVKYINSGLEVR